MTMTHKTYTVLPNIYAGMLTPKDLENLLGLIKKYRVPQVKITSAQRIAILGLAPDDLEALKAELQIPASLPHAHKRVHYVQACPGNTWCKYGVSDALTLGQKIEQLELAGPLPAKVKVGVSGCRMCCCESWVRDVGLAAEKKGWQLIFGGNAAGRPRIGDLVAEGLSDDDAVALVEKTLNYYIQEARLKTRSARFMERIGIDALKKAVLG
jgi:NAD(P)H-nitrite reductase large subunit